MTIQYKYANPDKTAVNDQINGIWNITQDSWLWKDVESWIADGNTIEEYQTDIEKQTILYNSLISTLRTQKLILRDGGITVNGIKFDTDLEARMAYQDLNMEFQLDSTFTVENWKASAGVWITMTKDIFDAYCVAWKQHLSDIFTYVKTKETEIANATDLSTIDLTYTGS